MEFRRSIRLPFEHEGLEEKLNTVENRLSGMKEKLDGMENRFVQKLEDISKGMENRFVQKLEEISKGMEALVQLKGKDPNKEVIETTYSSRPKDELMRATILLKGATSQRGYLVICFYELSPMKYTFQVFPIWTLIAGSSQELHNLKQEFVWHEDNAVFDVYRPSYHHAFRHVGDAIYVVRSLTPHLVDWDTCYSYPDPESESDEITPKLHCISLSTPLENSQVMEKSKMRSPKVYPLVAEVDGCIYVLSAPPSCDCSPKVKVGFEVYDCMRDVWQTLRPPPILDKESEIEYSMECYSYFVFGKKLYVSSPEYSCVYGLETGKWEGCELFSGWELTTPYSKVEPPPLVGCGHAFPFVGEALLYKDNIFLGTRLGKIEPRLVAFKIIDGKAVNMRFHNDGLPRGEVRCLVKLGDDCFAFLLYKYSGKVTVVTFIVDSESEDGEEYLVCEIVNMTCSGGIKDRLPFYSFTW